MPFLILLAILLFPLLPAAAVAQEATPEIRGRVLERIIAVVNDDVITATDINDRLALAFFSSNLQPTPENKQRLAPQILRTLIDETIQRQEAKRLGITIAPDEIKQAALRLAQDNNVGLDQLEGLLAQRGVPSRTLFSQIEAGLMWSKVVQRRLRPLVEVGAEEVQSRLERLQANAGKPEYLVAEIFMRVDEPSEEAEVKAFADRLVEQIKGGASFPAMAQQFSQSAGALQGGDLGWVQQGQLATELDEMLSKAQQPGALTAPIRSPAGYHILLVRDQRLTAGVNPGAVQVTLSQVYLPSSEGFAERAQKLRDAARGCSSLAEDMRNIDSAAAVRNLGSKTLSDLPGWLGTSVQNLSVNQASEIYEVDGGALFVVLCDRKSESKDGGPTAEQITTQIGTERLELQARRLLRDLRRQATVEVR